MASLRQILKTVWNLVAGGFAILVCVFFCAREMIPTFYVLLAVSVLVLNLIRKKRRAWFPAAMLAAVCIFTPGYFWFEYVPRGTIRAGDTVNRIPFNQVAGYYYYGGGLGVNCTMRITPDGRFFFTWTGCLGVYDRNKGNVRIDGDFIRLSPMKPNEIDDYSGTPTTFMPIKWGERIYLIQPEKVIKFCCQINEGWEPRDDIHGRFYLKWGDWRKPAQGLPLLPAHLEAYLLKKPVRGTIFGLLGDKKAFVDIGSKDGLREGMTLTVLPDKGYLDTRVKVTRVEAASAHVEPFGPERTLKPGQRVVSRHYY